MCISEFVFDSLEDFQREAAGFHGVIVNEWDEPHPTRPNAVLRKTRIIPVDERPPIEVSIEIPAAPAEAVQPSTPTTNAAA